MGDGFAMAEGADSDRALEKVIGRLMRREGGRNLPKIRIASGTELDAAAAWCVAHVLLRESRGVPTDLDTIAAAVGRVPASVLLPAFDQTARSGYLTGDPAGWHTTETAREQWDVFATELERWLLEQLSAAGGTEEDAALLDGALKRLTSEVLGEEATANTPALQSGAAGHDVRQHGWN